MLAFACVDYPSDFNTFSLEILCCTQAVVVVCEHRNLGAGGDAKAVGIRADSTCLHDARAVVVGERHGTFCGTRSKDRALGIDAPEDVAEFAGAVVAAFKRAVDAVVVGAVDGGSGHDADVWHAGEFGGGFCREFMPLAAINLVGFGVEASAEKEVLVRENHTQTGSTSGQSCH